MVSDWDGKMYFVYLPAFERYLNGIEHINRENVLHTVSELDIPIIDMHREVFDPHPDPLSLFPLRTAGHYNAEGYRLVAEAISKRLKADGIIPLNSKN
jgi:lysophospholipase L1-like esterase